MTHHHLEVNKAYKWLEENKNNEFKWGLTDCCMTTCNFIKHMTGIDPAENHRGKYYNESGAKKALVRYGSIEDSFDSKFNRVSNINFSSRGDAVLYDLPNGKALGIKWSGGGLFMTDKGLTVIPLDRSKVIAIWRVFNA